MNHSSEAVTHLLSQKPRKELIESVLMLLTQDVSPDIVSASEGSAKRPDQLDRKPKKSQIMGAIMDQEAENKM